MKREARNQTVIEGVVTPCSWDDGGRVIGVALSARGEQEYAIHTSAKGGELIKLIHEHIRAKGTLRSKNQRGVFVVREYEIIS